MEHKSDKDLVNLSLKDKEAFLYLIKRYEERLFRYILRISSFSREEVEDILQEVFISIYRNLHNFDDKLSFSSWAYRIAHNKTISRFRFSKARPQTVSLDKEEVFQIASDIDLKKELDKNILCQQVLDIINLLKKEKREILILRYLEEKTYQEISDILKKSSGSVASLISQAKRDFKLKWQEKYEKQ